MTGVKIEVHGFFVMFNGVRGPVSKWIKYNGRGFQQCALGLVRPGFGLVPTLLEGFFLETEPSSLIWHRLLEHGLLMALTPSALTNGSGRTSPRVAPLF